MALVVSLWLLAGCTGDADNIELKLAPDLISSLDGTTTLTALVAAGTTPLSDQDVKVSIVYTDRNGTPHDIAPITGKTEAQRRVDHARSPA